MQRLDSEHEKRDTEWGQSMRREMQRLESEHEKRDVWKAWSYLQS